MKHEVEFKNWSPDKALRDLVEESIGRLDRLAGGLPEDAVFLRFLMEEHPTRTLYRASITLDVPGAHLPAQEERHDSTEAAREAARRAQLRRMKAGVASPANRHER